MIAAGPQLLCQLVVGFDSIVQFYQIGKADAVNAFSSPVTSVNFTVLSRAESC